MKEEHRKKEARFSMECAKKYGLVIKKIVLLARMSVSSTYSRN
jgi:hypothetical protein